MANKTWPVGVSGSRGVTRSKDAWMARHAIDGDRRYLGTFASVKDASSAYMSEVTSKRHEHLPIARIPPADLPLERVDIEPERLSVDRLRRILHYDQDTGIFTWMRSKANRPAGTRAGWVDPGRGYRFVRVDKQLFYEHRLAWLYMTGRLPDAEIDHRNSNPSDNSWVNLREATSAQNKMNQKRRESLSGLKGVSLDKRRGTWTAAAKAGPVRIRKSGFKTAEEARAAYQEIIRDLHGEFARVD
jgi:hypothetical protein